MIVAEIKNKTVAFLKKQYEFFTKVVFRKTESFKFRKTAIATVVMIASVLLPIFPFSTLTLAYEVKYDDKAIGYVSEEKVFKDAEEIVNDSFVGSISQTPELSVTIVPQNSLNTASEISNNLSAKLASSPNIVGAYGIYVNKKCIAASEDVSLLLNAIESYKSSVQADTNADIIIFDKNIRVKECLSLDSNFTTLSETVDIIDDNIDCKTGFYKKTTKKIKYKVVEKKDNTLYEGVTKVKSKGKKGKQQITKLTFYKNGKKISTETIEKTVVKKAKNKVVVKGTKKRPEVTLKKGAKYAWPLKSGASYYVSSGFGQRSGRLHKGIDIITDYGTKIIAAYDGVVTRASWFDSYGYCVDITHADGTLTRYAHCSKILVSVGDEVVMGQTIAKVGSTGRSTANHLHFEVRPNGGDPVNPYKYVKE